MKGTMNRPAAPFTSLFSRDMVIAGVALLVIALHMVLRFAFGIEARVLGLTWPAIPLLVALVGGGIPLVAGRTQLSDAARRTLLMPRHCSRAPGRGNHPAGDLPIGGPASISLSISAAPRITRATTQNQDNNTMTPPSAPNDSL